jgi:phytoene dehydrogenase-like protein
VRLIRGPEEADVIVIGSGPNGLICANYLARAGLDVIVVECAFRPGGGLSTEEVTLPLFRHNLHAYFMRWTPEYKLWTDLGLDETGLRMLLPAKQNALPTSDGRVLITYSDIGKTIEAVAAFNRDDAKRFGELLQECIRLSRTVIEPLRFSPPLGGDERHELLARSADGRRFLEMSSMSALDVVKETFESEELRALLLFTSALRGYLPVLDVPGTGYVVAQAIAGLINCLICEGGSFQLARALAVLLYKRRARIIAGNGAASIDVGAARAESVTLQDGRSIKARRAVVSNVPAPITLLDLVGRDRLDPTLTDELSSYSWNGEALFGAHLALDSPPSFGDRYEAAAALNLCLGYESSDDVERDIAEVCAGSIPSRAALHASVPTLTDPTQAPPGMHTAFGWQFVPSRPHGGDATYWDDANCESQLSAMVATWTKYAPNVAEAEIARTAHSPFDTQVQVPSMWLGDRHHGLYHPNNFYENRPTAALSEYRTPVEGLYLCGASNHPGGSVNGLAGYNAAGVIADDLGIDKWWRPVHARDALIELASA